MKVLETSRLQRIRVPLGFAFAIVFLLYADPTRSLLVSGLSTAFLGLAIRFWAAGHLRKHEELTVSGPYRWTRNPLYLGSFLLGLGFSIAAARIFILIAFTILFGAVYFPVMRKEEAEMLKMAGKSYHRYRKEVPRFLPTRFPSIERTDMNRFSWNRVYLNKEYKAVVGYLIISALLIVKLLWI